MELQILTRNMEMTPRLQEYVEKKVEKLSRFLPDIEEARMELAEEKTRSNAHRQVAQLTIWVRGTMLRAEERGADMFAVIDETLDKMSRQATRYKRRRQERRPRSEEVVPLEEEALPPAEIVRVKRFEIRSMTPEEAVDQMELLGHQFFLFLNANEGGVNVVYRRQDGTYGLIVPQVA